MDPGAVVRHPPSASAVRRVVNLDNTVGSIIPLAGHLQLASLARSATAKDGPPLVPSARHHNVTRLQHYRAPVGPLPKYPGNRRPPRR